MDDQQLFIYGRGEMGCVVLLYAVTFFAGLGCSSQTDPAFGLETEQVEQKCIVEQNVQQLSRSSLYGKWVSQRCETRTGPEYLLRSYTFNQNGTFYLLQAFFSDEFCSSSMYAISARGTFDFKSISSLNYKLSEVTIIVHDIEVAKNLSTLVKEGCRGMTHRYWKPSTEYVIFKENKRSHVVRNVPSDSNFNGHQYKSQRILDKSTTLDPETDPKCLLDLLQLSFEELNQFRMYKHMTQNALRSELWLAKSRLQRPVTHAFQLPLIFINESSGCPFCRIVSRSTNMFLPILEAKVRLPLSLEGEWISETCEPYPLQPVAYRRSAVDEHAVELQAIRNFRFEESTQRWELEMKYYSDYKCTAEVAVYQSYGRYYEGSPSDIVAGATPVDFEMDKAYLMVKEEWFLSRVQTDPSCGSPNKWHLGVKKELPSRCSNPQLNAPVRRSIARTDVEENGSFLYLGEEDTIIGRPTAYDYPLVQCKLKSLLLFSDTESDSEDSASSLKSFSYLGLIIVATLVSVWQ